MLDHLCSSNIPVNHCVTTACVSWVKFSPHNYFTTAFATCVNFFIMTSCHHCVHSSCHFSAAEFRNISCKANIELTLIVWLKSWIVGTWLNCNNSVGVHCASHSPSVITVSVPTPERYCQCVGVTHCPFKWHTQLSISNSCFTRHFGCFKTLLFSPVQGFCTHFSNQVSWTSFFLFHLLSHDKFCMSSKFSG